MPSSDEELQMLAEKAVNPDAFAAPTAAPLSAPVVGTPEGPGIPPVADPATPTAPVGLPPAVTPAPGVPPIQPSLKAPPTIPGIDTRALEQARGSADELAKAQAAKGPLIAGANEAEAGAADQLSQEKRDKAIELQAEEQAQKDGLAAAQKVADQAADEVKNFKLPDYWGDKTGAQKVMAHIGYALGAYAAGGSSGNGVNQAAEKIKMISQQNMDAAKAKLGTLQWAAEQKRRGVTDLQQAYRDDLAKLTLRQGMELQAASDEAKAYLLRSKTPLEEAENNVLVMKLKNDGDQAYAKGFQELVRDKAQLALEKARIGASYAAINESRREHDLQHEDRALTAITKTGATGDKTVVMDPDTGKKLGYVVGGKGGAAAFGTRDSDYGRALQQLEALKKDVVENGNRVLLPESVKRRNALKNNADIAVATVSPLGKTDEAMKKESASIGGGGAAGLNTDILAGANPDAINNKIKELKEQRERYRKSQLIGLDENEDGTPAADRVPTLKDVNANAVRSLPEADRKDAIDAISALSNPAKAAKAAKFLRHLGVM